MSSSLSAEIMVGTWDCCYDDDRFDGVDDFCESLDSELITYCVQYDSQEEYFLGIIIAESEDWGSKPLCLPEIMDKELAALETLKKIPELEGCHFQTELLPRYF